MLGHLRRRPTQRSSATPICIRVSIYVPVFSSVLSPGPHWIVQAGDLMGLDTTLPGGWLLLEGRAQRLRIARLIRARTFKRQRRKALMGRRGGAFQSGHMMNSRGCEPPTRKAEWGSSQLLR